MAESIQDRVMRVASDVLIVPAAQITGDTSPQTVQSWDSIQHLNLVLALEQELGVQFDPEDIERMRNVREIIAIAVAKLEG